MLPPLSLLGDAIGIFGGYAISVGLFGANPVIYWEQTFQYLDLNDVSSGLIKAAVLRAHPLGHRLRQGLLHDRRRRGRRALDDRAVVHGSLVILLSDFFLTKILF